VKNKSPIPGFWLQTPEPLTLLLAPDPEIRAPDPCLLASEPCLLAPDPWLRAPVPCLRASGSWVLTPGGENGG